MAGILTYFPVGGNQTGLMADSNAAVESMVADIDAGKDHVHLTFYTLLPDANGLKVVEALKRAAVRKVTCRAMADALGSRTLVASEHWTAMCAAGVRVATALRLEPVMHLSAGPGIR
jgi:cardiolipin synthase